MAKLYTGKRTHTDIIGTVEVITHQQGNKVRKRKLRHIPFHSPSGFSWGYGGSGPADLALAILVDYLRERPPAQGYTDPTFSLWTVKSQAWKYHQPFKWHFVAKFEDDWELYDTQIEQWLKKEETRKETGNA